MQRLAWASVRAHPIRLIATSLSVVLGIAFVSGTFVLTDTVRVAIAQLVDAQGEPLGGQSPTTGADAPSVEGLESVELRSGRFPVDGSEVAIDVASAELLAVQLG